MNGQIVSEDNINTAPPMWQHPVLPGNAIQGSILLTVNNFINPPEDMSNFKWLPMEQVIGIANVKCEYEEETNEYKFYKTKGHLNNDGEWVYEWELFATFSGITDEVQEALRNMVYVSYEYDTQTANYLKIYGVKKDGTRTLINQINFATQADLNTAITNLTTVINNEASRASQVEGQLETAITGERNRAIVKEGELQTNITAEQTRATTAEQGLQTNITAEETRAIATENMLAADINTLANNGYAWEEIGNATIDFSDGQLKSIALSRTLQANELVYIFVTPADNYITYFNFGVVYYNQSTGGGKFQRTYIEYIDITSGDTKISRDELIFEGYLNYDKIFINKFIQTSIRPSGDHINNVGTRRIIVYGLKKGLNIH